VASAIVRSCFMSCAYCVLKKLSQPCSPMLTRACFGCSPTHLQAFDILTPLGRGQAQQVVGPQGSGKTQLCIDAVLGQRGTGVRCVYAAVGSTPEQLRRTVEDLRQHGCLEYTSVVAASGDKPLGEQYAAMLTACSIGERIRDEGGHSLVVLNDASVMVSLCMHATCVCVCVCVCVNRARGCCV
jgi:F0F1-type ATP synthase alpha subunit